MNIFKLFVIDNNAILSKEEHLTILEEIKNNSGEILRTMESKTKEHQEMQEKYRYDPSSKYYNPNYIDINY